MSLGGNDTYKKKLVKILKAKTKCLKKKKNQRKKNLQQIKRKNFKICIMSLEGNNTYKNKLVNIS